MRCVNKFVLEICIVMCEVQQNTVITLTQEPYHNNSDIISPFLHQWFRNNSLRTSVLLSNFPNGAFALRNNSKC
jgi:hypothetical protein